MKNTYAFILLFIFNLTTYSQSDCPDAIIVCGDASYRGLNATGVGVQELEISNPCHSVEHNSLWLKILIKDGGTLGFVLTPDSPALVVDFDFWIFGPNVECDSIGQTVRCSTTNPLQSGTPHNLTGMDDIEPDVAEGPGTNGNSFINWMTVQDDETYYLIIDRPVGSSDFSLAWTGTATFHDVPVFNNPDNIPLDMEKCDQDGVDDQSTAFDLTQYAEMFLGSQTDVILTYHADSNDMTTGNNPMENPAAFANGSNPGTAFLRMTNTITGCYETLTFGLSIITDVSAGEPEDLVQCDTNGNGLQVFDLTQNDDEIKNGDEGTIVSYYRTQEDAEDKIEPLEALYQNEEPYTLQTIWARLENITGCYGFDIKNFTIDVIPLPTFNNLDGIPLRITKCDSDTVDDNSTDFDLTVFEPMFTGSQTDILFSYHQNGDDAATGDNPIDTPEAYANTSSPQTIYVRMLNMLTGCSAVETFEIEIVNILVAGSPADIALCDIDKTGLMEFDLSVNDAAVRNGAQDTVVTYYASQEDAENDDNPLPLLYQNTTPYTGQVIWARLESIGCFGYDLASFNISIMPLPLFNNPGNIPLDLKQCDADGTDDNSTPFNLAQHEALFTGTQTDIVFSYHKTNDEALSGDNAIASPEDFANTSNPHTIYVRMLNNVTGCSNIITFEIEITSIVAGEPADLAQCDENGDGLQQFDLTQNDTAIINGNTDASVTYYRSQPDAESEMNPIGPLFQNEVPYTSQTIWARLENTNGCFGHSLKSFSIIVNPLPVFNNPQDIPLKLEQCDSDGVDDLSTAFNLTQHEAMFAAGQPDIVFTYHSNSANAISGADPITVPTAFPNTSNPQVIHVRMTNTLTGCFSVSEFEIEISNPITAGEPANLALCDFDENGFRNFNLALNDDAIKNGMPGTMVTYFSSPEDAENNTNPINDIYQNELPYATQTLWARLENISGCFGYDIKSFTISILRLPDINFDLKVKDFTKDDNSISIIIADPELYEYSLDGSQYSGTTVFDGLIPGIYTIFIRSKDGCREITKEVAVLNYPKFFTPNGDTYNDIWKIPFLYFFPDALVTIFDRYGKVITRFYGVDRGWDGTYNGYNLPSTDYWFVLAFKSGRTIKGHFSMLR